MDEVLILVKYDVLPVLVRADSLHVYLVPYLRAYLRHDSQLITGPKRAENAGITAIGIRNRLTPSILGAVDYKAIPSASINLYIPLYTTECSDQFNELLYYHLISKPEHQLIKLETSTSYPSRPRCPICLKPIRRTR